MSVAALFEASGASLSGGCDQSAPPFGGRRPQTIAWTHTPLTGERFGTTLAHWANPRLPCNATLDSVQDFREREKSGRSVGFHGDYPSKDWFPGVFWEKHVTSYKVEWSDYSPVGDFINDWFRGRFFAMFRNPAARAVAGFEIYGEDSELSRREYAERLGGSQALLLSGQRGA